MGKRRFAVTGSGDLSVTDVSRYDSKGVESHTRGWDLGIKVVADVDENNRDRFTITVTGGSHDPGSKEGLLIVTDFGDGDYTVQHA